jgi:hypothetical protein
MDGWIAKIRTFWDMSEICWATYGAARTVSNLNKIFYYAWLELFKPIILNFKLMQVAVAGHVEMALASSCGLDVTPRH